MISVMSELAIHTNVEDPFRYGCLILKKADKLGMRTCVLFDTPEDLDRFDELLWTFDDYEFIAHAKHGEFEDPLSPHHLSLGLGQLKPADMLVLLSHHPYTKIGQLLEKYPKVIDIVARDDPLLTEGRRRFVAYRNAGITPVVHNRGQGA
jgi:DNA polymerase-3 subunit chi